MAFGRVHVAGKSLADAEKLVKDVVAKVYRDPEVQITHADATNVPPGFGSPVVPDATDFAVREKLERQVQRLMEELQNKQQVLDKINKPQPDDAEVQKLNRTIEELESTIRELKKQQSSAVGVPSRPGAYNATQPSYNPYQQATAPSSQLRNAFNPFAPNGPVGPLDFDPPPADQAETKRPEADDPFKPNVKPHKE